MEEIFADLPEVPEPGETLEDLRTENSTMEAEAKDAAKEVKELKNVTAEVDPWEKPKMFGKWVGMEIGKGALFVVGMKAVEAAFSAATKPANGTPSKEALKSLQQAEHSREAMDKAKKILDAWHKWLLHNYTKRQSFGSVTTQGVKVTTYQIFQGQILALDDIRNGAVTKAATKAVKSKTSDDLKAMIKQEQKLVKEIVKATKWLKEYGKKLTKADNGVGIYSTEAAEAQKLLGGAVSPDDGAGEDAGENTGEDTGEDTENEDDDDNDDDNDDNSSAK